MRLIRESQTRAVPTDPTFFSSWRQLAGMGGDVRPYEDHAWVYSAANVLSENLAGCPVKMFSGDEEEPVEVTGGEWNALFRDPNPELTARELWSYHWLQKLLYGEVFWLLLGMSGDPVKPGQIPRFIWPYPGSDFVPVVHPNTGQLEAWTQTFAGRPIRRELHEVMQDRLINPYDWRRGLAPQDAAAKATSTDVAAASHNESMLRNGATPGGIISPPPANVKSVGMTVPELAAVKKEFEDRHKGAGKAGKTLFLPGGLAFTRMADTNRDMEFLQQREWSRKEILGTYRVPLMLVGDTEELHSKESAKATLRFFWENRVIPLLRQTQDTMSVRLFMGRGSQDVWPQFDLSHVKALAEDEDEQVTTAERLWKLGVSLQELNRRFTLGLEEQPGWDVPYLPNAIQPAEFAGDEPEEPEPPPQFGAPPPPPAMEPEEEEPTSEDDEGRSAPSARDPERLVRWRAYIRAIQGPGEKRMRSAIIKWLRKVRKDVMKWLGSQRSRALTEDELEEFLLASKLSWDADIVAKTTPITEWIVGKSLDSMAAESGISVPKTSPEILAFVEEMGARKVTHTSTTVQKDIRRSIIKGMAEGESIADIQKRVAATFNAEQARSLTIARTESGAAATGSRFRALEVEEKETGETGEIEWITAGDSEVRDSHAGLDGDRVKTGETFDNGLRYPLDENGAAEEVINCRCDWIPV